MSLTRRLVLALIAVVLISLTNASAQTFDRDGKTVRSADTSAVPGFPDVTAEYLQIPGADAPQTPAALNTATFLRLRAASDNENPRPANAVVVAMPGFASTPSHWLYLGSQLVHKAGRRTCADNSPCRVEVWIVQRRGANLADTAGGRTARAKKDPDAAIEYYFGNGVLSSDSKRPGKWPLVAPQTLVGRAGSKWLPLKQADVPFMADWGFEVYAGDVDRMIALVKEQSGSKNIFLAGHSQGGGFVANYAGRLRPDGKRGYEILSGLIFLDGGPAAGAEAPPTAQQMSEYFDRVGKLRSGAAPVFTDAAGALGNLSGPVAAAASVVVNAHYNFKDPNSESIFGPRAVGSTQFAPAGDAFLSALRLTYRARAGMSFDVDPVPGASMQIQLLTRLGEGLGKLDFKPLPGTETQCDSAKAPPPCIPSAAQVDPNKLYGWLEGGGNGTVSNRAGKAQLWMDSQGFAPSRSNIKPVTVNFAASGKKTIDASNMIATNFYPSERYDGDMGFIGRFRTFKIQEQGTNLDIDKGAITGIPVYVARQNANASLNNPFPRVSDFTEVNKKGTFQTDEAKRITPFDPAINAALYFHTDFVSVDDSLEGKGVPGQPGVSAVSNTLIDWMLKRSKGRAVVPTPKQLGVVKTY
ncbi:MAG: alpha/beta hydrolase [Blastocatellia bacterium]